MTPRSTTGAARRAAPAVRPARPAVRAAPRATTRTLQSARAGGLVRCTTLPGGIRVITEAMPHVRSVTYGIWVGVGSRDETGAQAGSAHYLEHLLFKGTERRDALAISAPIDAVGGEMNAFTTKEYTCYYARVLDADVPLAVDIVTDMVTASLIRTEDVDAERDVILEEIAMHDDDPGDCVHDEFAQALFGDAPLGRPILGTVDTITAISRTAINRFYRSRYRPENIVVAAAGNLDHTALVGLVRKALRHSEFPTGAPAGPARPRGARRRDPERLHVVRDTEQTNFVLGVPALTRDDPRRYALAVLNAALGGGMSSRLFQEVREKRGLAYSVYSFASQFEDAGMFGVTAGCLPSKLDQVLEICRDQLAAVAREGITAEELDRGRGQLRGATMLGLEDTGSRMTRIAKGELLHGELPTPDEILRRIAAVTSEDVADLAAQLLSVEPTLAVVGPDAA